MDINSIRGTLSEHINYSYGEKLRKMLHEHSRANYVPIYSDSVYIIFMNDNACTFEVNGAQSKNHPYYFTLFTTASQHVMGDCVYSCLDAAIKESAR